MKATALTAAALLYSLAPGASAQVADNPEVYAKLDAFGINLTREMVGGTQAIYREMYESFSNDGLRITRDVTYGKHERHVLDVYSPEYASGAPVMIFALGGDLYAATRPPLATSRIGRHATVWLALPSTIALRPKRHGHRAAKTSRRF